MAGLRELYDSSAVLNHISIPPDLVMYMFLSCTFEIWFKKLYQWPVQLCFFVIMNHVFVCRQVNVLQVDRSWGMTKCRNSHFDKSLILVLL